MYALKDKIGPGNWQPISYYWETYGEERVTIKDFLKQKQRVPGTYILFRIFDSILE